MKKKLVAAFLCVAMAATLLAGCGSSSSSTSTETTEEATDDAEETAEEVVEEAADAVDLSDAYVAVFYYTFSDTYTSSVRAALDGYLDELGVDYEDFDGNNSATTQNEQVDTAIAAGADLLIVNIVTSGSVDASQQIVDKAEAADLPIIFFNKPIEGDDEENVVLGSYDKLAFVGTDAPEAGHLQGQMIGEYLVEHYDEVDLNGDGEISYTLFKGEATNVEAIYRSQYAVEDANEVLTEAGYPELVFFDSSNTDGFQLDTTGAWSAQAALDYMTTNLSQYNEENGNMIELVICNNDAMAEGAVSALNTAGYNTGEDGVTTIPVFGVDATDAAKQLIAEGKMTGTVMQDADGMAACVAFLASNALSGKDIMDGTDDYNIADGFTNKIYIAYSAYTGE